MHREPAISSIERKSVTVTHNVLSASTLLPTSALRRSRVSFPECYDFLSVEQSRRFQFQGLESVSIKIIE